CVDVYVLSPTWPYWPEPQHAAVPLAKRAQVWAPPPASCATPVRRPVPATSLTRTGRVRCAKVPSPSSANVLRPQHAAPPPVSSAHVWEPPATIWVIPESWSGPLAGGVTALTG